jgi:predicted ATPase
MANNHFYSKIGFTKDFRVFKEGETFDLKAGINLLVGDQGCGKSSILWALPNWGESGIGARPLQEFAGEFSYVDTEKMNPRFQEAFKHTNGKESLKSVNDYEKAEINHAVQRLTNRIDEKSHGTVIKSLLTAMDKEEGKLILIDEPESGLSIRSQFSLLEFYRKLAERNQLLIATHSMIFIKEIGEVLSIEHRKWMTADEFIETQISY